MASIKLVTQLTWTSGRPPDWRRTPARSPCTSMFYSVWTYVWSPGRCFGAWANAGRLLRLPGPSKLLRAQPCKPETPARRSLEALRRAPRYRGALVGMATNRKCSPLPVRLRAAARSSPPSLRGPRARRNVRWNRSAEPMTGNPPFRPLITAGVCTGGINSSARYVFYNGSDEHTLFGEVSDSWRLGLF